MMFALGCIVGMIVGFLIACRLFAAMKGDFFHMFNSTPKGE